MKRFYIETDQLTKYDRLLRYVYKELSDEDITLEQIVDPSTGEKISIEELKMRSDPTSLINMATAYKGNYKRHYF